MKLKFSRMLFAWTAPLLLALAISLRLDAATVENVRAAQRPRSNVVEVFYDLVAPEGGVYDVSVSIAGGGVEPPISTLSGDWGADIIPGRNKKIEWDAGADWAQHVQSNFVATVTATRSDADTGPSKGMVRIPGGTNSGTDPDFGAYSLSVESFYMDKTEVTYAHWKRVYNWAVTHGYSFNAPGSGKANNHPVHTVGFYDCLKWCNARSEMEGRTPAYHVNGAVLRTGSGRGFTVDINGNGYRLATDSEWEYAARGGLRGYRFPWGNKIRHSRANYYSCTTGSTTYTGYAYDLSFGSGFHPRYDDAVKPYTAPVASFAPNRYGLYDMAGNIREYAHWDRNGSGQVINYVINNVVVLRGGDWMNYPYDSRCHQGYHAGSDGYIDRGFRCVRRR